MKVGVQKFFELSVVIPPSPSALFKSLQTSGHVDIDSGGDRFRFTLVNGRNARGLA